jgi:hypothetical protein
MEWFDCERREEDILDHNEKEYDLFYNVEFNIILFKLFTTFHSTVGVMYPSFPYS